MDWKIPLFATDIAAEETEAVMRVLSSGWLTMGEETSSFEREFATYAGVRHAFMVSNCTAALHLAHHVLGAGTGDEIICPSLTFVATANTIVQTGARPVFADIAGSHDFTVSPADIERKISSRTKGIVVMHYAGYPCAMDAIMSVARNHGLYVVEDCAHSPGSFYQGKHTGGIGDIGCFSFFSNKNLSTGEGGMIVTDRDDLAERIRLLRSHGMTTVTLDRHKGHAFSYDVVDFGFNYRSSEINAALGRVQLKKLSRKNEQRALLVRTYREAFAGVKGVVPVFGECREDIVSAEHIFPVLLSPGADRQEVMHMLRDKGVQTSIHYRPVHTFAAYVGTAQAAVPLTDEVGGRILTLPLFPAMTGDQVRYVVGSVTEAVSAH